MLSFFRTNQFVFNLLVLLYAIGLRFSYFLNPVQPVVANDGVLSDFFKTWLTNPLLEGIIATLFLFLQAVLINNLAMKHRLFNDNTLLPGLFYVLSMSLLQDFFPLSSILFGNFFLIIALDQAMSTYKQPKCADTIFNAGFWIGIASLFYSSFALFFLLVFIGIGLLRNFKWKERIMLLCGFLVPFLFVSAWFFWQDSLSIFWQTYFVEQFSFLNFQYEQTSTFLIKLGLLILLFLLGFFNNYDFSKSNQIRSYVNLIYLTLIVSGLTFLVQPNVTILHFLIIMVPLSFLLTARFLAFDKSIAELAHAFILIVVLFFQYRGFEGLFG